jgi:hypothetical protein
MGLSDLFTSRLSRPAGRVLDAPIRDVVHEILREHGYASPAEVQVLRDELRDLRARVEAVDKRLADLTRITEDARTAATATRAEIEAARTDAASARAEATTARTEATAARSDATAARKEARDAATAAAAAPSQAPLPDDVASEAHVAALEVRVSELEAELQVMRAPVEPTPAAAPVAAPAPAQEAPAPLTAEPHKDCKVPGCAEPVRSKGFCSAHYQQWRRGTLKGFVSLEGTALVEGKVVHLPADAVGGAVTSRDGRIFVDGRAVSPV